MGTLVPFSGGRFKFYAVQRSEQWIFQRSIDCGAACSTSSICMAFTAHDGQSPPIVDAQNAAKGRVSMSVNNEEEDRLMVEDNVRPAVEILGS